MKCRLPTFRGNRPWHRCGLSAVVVGGIACLAGCGERDVTKNPAYGFGVIAGTSWKTKVSIALSSIDRGYYGQICTDGYAASFDAGTANPREFDYNSPVKAVLPAGTVIRFDRLVAGGGDLGGYFVYSTVQSGKHVGKIVTAPRELFLPNDFLDPGHSNAKTWAINPKNLEKP